MGLMLAADNRAGAWRRGFRVSGPVVVGCALALLSWGCKKKVVAQPPVVNPPAPVAAKPRPRHQPAPAALAAPPPAPVPPAPPASVPPSPPLQPPKLGLILTPGEVREYNSTIDQSLASARTNLNAIGSRSLSPEQQAAVQQIKDFMQQAQAARTTDLPAAKGLADKAEVLARDLLRSLRQ